MPAKKKLTKKKPAAKAAQPSSKKRPMSTKAKPAVKKAAPKAKAKPMAKKPALRPLRSFHEGGMIDADLLAEQTRRNEQQMPKTDRAVRPRQGSFPKPPQPLRPTVPADPNYVPVDPGYNRPRPTRVPFNQPFMNSRPQPTRPQPTRPQPTRPTVSPQNAAAIAAANRFRFSGPQVTPQMQAAARQMQQGTNAGITPRPMNRGGMVARPKLPIHPDMPASFGQVPPNKPTGRR